ncbi:YbaK/EbsC family protein [Gryllotalpicola sp.]|uniref:aminoacyl-tRNA deacylase n=1 Tax=Gryllotalpicola sp. TaxID=1932787 RepID=UPI002619A701|nr:YbaK/EbsC family protein [Gryllotalpicola sp.]
MADAFEGLTGTSRVAADAAARGLAVEIIPRPRANSLTEAAALLGVAPSGIVKTLVVGRHDGSFLLALVPGGRKISWPKLRALVGVNRLAMPDPEVAKEATGYERGTITPLGSAIAWPVFADVTIVGQTIHLGSGEHGFSARAEADDLIAAYGATVADITELDE